MATYISLAKWTQLGIQNIKDGPARRDQGRQLAKSMGIDLREVYVVMGGYDLVLIYDAPDDETAARFMLTAGSAGNFSTQTMRAFNESEFDALVASLPTPPA